MGVTSGKRRRGVDRQKLIIILVGLPGRGKTFLCNKLLCYLNWWGSPGPITCAVAFSLRPAAPPLHRLVGWQMILPTPLQGDGSLHMHGSW